MINIKNEVLWMLDNQSHTDNTSTLKSADTYLPVFFWAQCVDSSGMFISFFVMLGKIIYRVLLLRSHEYGAWAKCYSHSEVEELKKNYFHLIPEKQSRYRRDFTPESMSYNKQSVSSRRWLYFEIWCQVTRGVSHFSTQLQGAVKSVTLLTSCQHAGNDRFFFVFFL